MGRRFALAHTTDFNDKSKVANRPILKNYHEFLETSSGSGYITAVRRFELYYQLTDKN